MRIDKNGYPLYLDETAEIIDTISISAGQWGLQLFVSGPDLIRATNATLAALTK